MRFFVKSFISSSGERFSQLYDHEDLGFPMFYPTAFVTRSVRINTTHGTQLVYLDAIKRLCEWEAKNSLDLIKRFQSLKFLTAHEVDDLTQHLRSRRRSGMQNTINTHKGSTYITYVSAYLAWLATNVINDSFKPDIAQMIEKQAEWLMKKAASKSGSQSWKDQSFITKRITDVARRQLLELYETPFIGLSSARERHSRLRNIVMLRILYETGMRRGELLSLKLKHINESIVGETAYLTIERNHDDSFDTRINQPVAKTAGRVVPISQSLEKQLLQYISEHRALVEGVSFDDESFIFVNHRRGKGQGQPISISNFNEGLNKIKASFPSLGTLHPHLLRHDWNFRFSLKVDEANLEFEKEAELRETLMGWRPKSDMSRRYNLRHIQAESLRLGLEVANMTDREDSKS